MNEKVHQRLTLAASITGAALVALDGTILLVAQPEMRRDLHASVAEVQWSSTAYLVAVAAFLVIAGRVGDRYGHLRLLVVGSLGFAAAAAAIAFAPGIGWVIALRGVQGIFGALLQPATLAMLRLVYPADRLGTPIAIRTSAIGLAAAVGPVLGGILIAHFEWRAVFVMNIPIALAIAACAAFLSIPTLSTTHPKQLNLLGSTLLAGTLAILVHTLVRVPGQGWTTTPTLLGWGGCTALAVAFVFHERRAADPIVARAVALSVPVMASMLLLLMTTAGMFGALFVSTFFFQDVVGLGPLDTGMSVLPLTALMVLGAPLANKAARRYGPRLAATIGVGLAICGIAGLSTLVPSHGRVMSHVSLALLGLGFAAIMVTATGTVVGDAPPGHAGVVGGIKQTAMNIGPTIGIAVATNVMLSGLGSTNASMSSALQVLALITALALIPAAFLPRTVNTIAINH
ncbi:MAG: MFS transporter [Corynebacteriales bacterium]|nr:MFS transporter [Mycobacteriales bacterium]